MRKGDSGAIPVAIDDRQAETTPYPTDSSAPTEVSNEIKTRALKVVVDPKIAMAAVCDAESDAHAKK